MVLGIVALATAVVMATGAAGGGLMNRRRSYNKKHGFSKPPELEYGSPGGTPPHDKEIGGYCIRAQCNFIKQGKVVGNVVGHDDTMEIIHVVEDNCLINAVKHGLKCSRPQVNILPHLKGRICDGIVFNIDAEKLI